MVTIKLTDRRGRQVEVDAPRGRSLMEAIRDLDASVDAICGGMCACATCHVYIDPAFADCVPPRSFEEQLMLGDSPHYDPERSRLSCQIRVDDALDKLELTVAPEE